MDRTSFSRAKVGRIIKELEQREIIERQCRRILVTEYSEILNNSFLQRELPFWGVLFLVYLKDNYIETENYRRKRRSI